MKSSKLILGIFLIVSILDIIGISIGNETMKYIFKPLIMLTLMAYYSVVVNNENKLYLAALFFAFIGDVLLMFDTQLNFILGLISFLIAHVLYIIIIVKLLNKSTSVQKTIAIVPFLIFYIGLIYLLKDSMGEMLIPVVIYGLIISTFGAVSFLNYLTKKSVVSLVLLGGALFFIVSDSTLAIDKFYQSEGYFSILIMLTYILAQYLICRFMIVESENKE
ncbi:lysoplasmalogenase [Urechidicola croceus]|uniref:Lysoplasmalogenase n=1 Tax=Urechidicola croceus TaxID=1850246 RepID=A0A1D8P3N6_9FLAO|nr:lysoplasmalogenase [Urechidicola croceus]AOW19183.1 hypothetical protein LPB138_00100 [Urechidicola croceus]